MKIKNIFLLIITLLSLGSCVKEKDQVGASGDNGKELDVRLRIDTKAAGNVADDNTIDRVRIIVVASNGRLMFNSVVTPVANAQGIEEYPLKSAFGNNDFYVICNESADLGLKLNDAKTKQEIEGATFEYTTPIKPPFVMYGTVNGTVKKQNDVTTVDFKRADGTVVNNADKLIVDVKRIVAKVSLSFIKTTAADANFEISNIRAKVCQMPKYGYIASDQRYSEATWLPNYNLSLKPTSATSLVDNATGSFNSATNKFDISGEHIEMEDFYIPEHFLATAGNSTKYTYIIITADAKTGSATYTANWRIDVSNNSDYDIRRNTHYNILGKISGLGTVDLYADIVMMNVYDLEVGWRPQDGLVIVSDKAEHYGNNIMVTGNANVYSGILKFTKDKIYNDVLFKYGSLVAVDGDMTGTFTNSAIVWKPDSFVTSITSWSDIPYLITGDVAHTMSTIQAAKGDPCKLAGLSAEAIASGLIDNGSWHMASESELQRLIQANDYDDPSVPQDSRGYNTYHSLLVPSTKWINASGIVNANNGEGKYWSSKNTKSFVFNSLLNEAKIAVESEPDQAFTVRCIRNVIPEPIMSVSQLALIPYTGNMNKSETFRVSTNVPYWKAELMKTDNVGNSVDFDDFSFGSRTSSTQAATHTVFGVNGVTDTANVYLTPKDIQYPNTRTFNFKVSGLGYDGQSIERIVTATQHYYYWTTKPNVTQDQLVDGKIANKKHNITVVVTINPEVDYIPLDNTKNIRVEVSGYGYTTYVSPAVQIKSGQYQYSFDIPIEVNKTPAVRGIVFTVKTTLPNSNMFGSPNVLSIMQNN